MEVRTIKQFLQNHRAELAKFTVIGAATLAAQLILQHFEAGHGVNVVRWTMIQGAALGTVGMVLNKVWTFKHRRLSWTIVILLWNIQRIPHFIASTALFVLLYSVLDWTHAHATLATAGALGLASFFMTCYGSMREHSGRKSTNV